MDEKLTSNRGVEIEDVRLLGEDFLRFLENICCLRFVQPALCMEMATQKCNVWLIIRVEELLVCWSRTFWFTDLAEHGSLSAR